MDSRRREPGALSPVDFGGGTIYKRKSDGLWCAALGHGKKRRVLYGPTKRDVTNKLIAVQLEMRQKHLRTDRVPTVAEYLEYWLHQAVKPRVRPLTYAGYSVNVRNHLVPTLGKIRLDRLSPQDVQQMMNDRLAAGFSPKTVTYMQQVLRTALELARRWEIIDRNVASLVDPPRRVRPTIRPLDPSQARAFLQSLRGNRLEALFSVALALGLRQGEALGLRWEDIDMASGVLRIRSQLQRINGRLTLVEPKTERSRRTLVVPPTILGHLREHEQRQAAERLWAGSKWTESSMVFSNRVGGPLQARNVIREFHKALRTAGLKRIRFHDLRHSCATLLLVQHVPARVVMEVLGHSEISTTMDTYSHIVPELQREAAERVEAILSERIAGGKDRDR
jgi:integrase